MMTNISDLLKEVAALKRMTESDVLTRALEEGLRSMLRDHTCLEYLEGKISRQEVIQKVGIDWVELVERKQQIVMEDAQKCLN